MTSDEGQRMDTPKEITTTDGLILTRAINKLLRELNDDYQTRNDEGRRMESLK